METEVELPPLEQVLDHIERLVFDELQPGDDLPSEGAIAEQLGVSRLTVREGIKQLTGRGLVETHNGRRPRVARPDGRGVGDYFRSAVRRDPTALYHLLEVRRGIETHNAELAARNATRPTLDAMAGAIQEMNRNLDDIEAFNDADLRFHQLLAIATGNPMLATIVEELSAVLHASQVVTAVGHARRGKSPQDSLDHHAAILERIRDRDAAGAAAAMRRHLREAEKDLRAGL